MGIPRWAIALARNDKEVVWRRFLTLDHRSRFGMMIYLFGMPGISLIGGIPRERGVRMDNLLQSGTMHRG